MAGAAGLSASSAGPALCPAPEYGGDPSGASRLLRLADRLLGVPFALVALAGEENADPAGAGDAADPPGSRRRTLRECALCPAVVPAGKPVAVADVREETAPERAAVADAGFLSYAAAPLAGSDGQVLGSLCVFDVRVRQWTAAELQALQDLAAWVSTEVELRRELAQRRSMEVQLQHNALYDPLTGLPNRLLFMERLSHAVLRAKRREGQASAVLFLDLDRFKVVNDSLGHHAGDELLIAIAGRLKACLRTEDTVARLGGDEFAVLLEGVSDVADATRVAQRIQKEMTSPINLGGYEVFTSTSIGIALASTYDRPEHLLRNADMAMYRAKGSGRSRYDVFDRKMHAEALARLQLETDLRRAVERQEFHVHYQPVISLATGKIAGFEALLRWHHPEQGPIAPLDFIPVAEETGLILPIGRWILGEACRQLRTWQAKLPARAALAMSVNLSVKQFSQPDLVGQVQDVLRETGLDPSCLKLEITESVIVDNTAFATTMLNELKALGIQVYLDDFGTGYSSLGYLHRLPLDVLKIDRSFVSQMEEEGKHFQLVRTILTLARSVGVRTVAEGVTTAEQLRELRALGADFAQGYLFSRPVSSEAAEALLCEDPRW